MWVRALADADDTCGGKAKSLARLIAAGLPVPDGFVVEPAAFRAIVGDLPARDEIGHALARAAERIEQQFEDVIPREVIDDVRARAAEKVAVRSSATVEDAAARSGAGVFASVTDVPAADVWSAIRAVWSSALTPLATAYAREHEMQMAVIIQRFVPGDRITVYTRAPGAPEGDKVVVQRGEQVREATRGDRDPIVALALRAEHAIGADRGADVELVEDREGTSWVVQARPIIHPPSPSRVTPPPTLLAPLVADGRRWTWDVTHNPDPLSPAQAYLVERVERAGCAPWSMRVVAGYLYTTKRGEPRGGSNDPDEIERRFAQILDVEDARLDEAITRYLAFYDVWSNEMVPLIAANRATSHEHRPSSVEATLLCAARGEITEDEAIARLSPLAPAWDVAVQTFGEQPEALKSAIARARTLQIELPKVPSKPIADLAERDDFWFARAQRLVRQALLTVAAERGFDRGDICWLSPDSLDISVEESRRRASAARAAHARASKWAMPLEINGEPEESRQSLQGFGSGAKISGRVVHFGSLASAVAVTSGDVIVTRAITPALAVFVIGCAAIISETGGPLDHGAAIARELGIPFIVGCKDAWSLLRDGMHVTIDGDRVFSTRN
jgi:pyruvate,water dikinase